MFDNTLPDSKSLTTKQQFLLSEGKVFTTHFYMIFSEKFLCSQFLSPWYICYYFALCFSLPISRFFSLLIIFISEEPGPTSGMRGKQNHKQEKMCTRWKMLILERGVQTPWRVGNTSDLIGLSLIGFNQRKICNANFLSLYTLNQTKPIWHESNTNKYDPKKKIEFQIKS